MLGALPERERRVGQARDLDSSDRRCARLRCPSLARSGQSDRQAALAAGGEGSPWSHTANGAGNAETHARASLRLAKEIDDKLAMVEAIFGLAGIAAATEDPARAARLAAAAELHHPQLAPEGMTLDDEVRASTETAKAASDPGIWQEAWAAASAMSLDEAADAAQLGET